MVIVKGVDDDCVGRKGVVLRQTQRVGKVGSDRFEE